MVYIYVLIDPRNNRIRYVGQTARKLSDRYSEHCEKQRQNNHRTHWLELLRALNLKPIMQVIEECNESNWAEREIYWIAEHKRTGCDLVNDTLGGEGGSPMLGKKHTEETRRKQSAAALGRSISEEVKTIIGNKNRGKKRSQEVKQAQSINSKAYWSRVENREQVAESVKQTWLDETTRTKRMTAQRKNAQSILSDSDVLDIRKRKADGESINSIATIYGVSYLIIWRIVKKITRYWLED